MEIVKVEQIYPASYEICRDVITQAQRLIEDIYSAKRTQSALDTLQPEESQASGLDLAAPKVWPAECHSNQKPCHYWWQDKWRRSYETCFLHDSEGVGRESCVHGLSRGPCALSFSGARHMNEQEAFASMGYFEGAGYSDAAPDWVRWFIELGLKYPAAQPGVTGRSVLLVSTPCDSPAAGLISLGVVMRDTARQNASDEQSHARTIRSWAKQYLDWCKLCDLRCRPSQKKCGFSRESLGEIFQTPDRPGGHRNKFLVESLDDNGTLTLREASRANARGAPVIMRFGPGSTPDAMLVQFLPDGWAPPITPPNRPPLSKGSFSSLSPDWRPLHGNLSQSYSGACLVGRKAGTLETKNVLKNSGFMLNGVERDLSTMLSIMEWGEDSVSRLRFYNTRGGSGFDRQGVMPEIAIVDGARPLVDVFAAPTEFGHTNVIGVVARDVDEEHLESLSIACSEFLIGFKENDFLPEGKRTPDGVSIRWLTTH